MKRWTVMFLTAACALSLAACGTQKPSLDEVKQAIAEGTVTLEDAVGKGWVTQEWADEYLEENSVPAADKGAAGAIGAFSTTTLSGDEFTREQMADVTLFVFLDPTDPDAEPFYQALADGYEGVKASGADILVCTKGEEGNEMFAEAPFPVIQYNDSLKNAVGNYTEMIEGQPNVYSWCVNASFYSAWSSSVESEELGEDAAGFVQMQKEMSEQTGIESGETAVVMG